MLTRPTFAKSDILAKSVAKSGVSCIFSRSAFEHRGESMSACTYRSRNVTAVPRPSSFVDDEDEGDEDDGSVKTRSWSAKTWWRRSYWRSRRVSGSASWCFIAKAFRRANDELERREVRSLEHMGRRTAHRDVLVGLLSGHDIVEWVDRKEKRNKVWCLIPVTTMYGVSGHPRSSHQPFPVPYYMS